MDDLFRLQIEALDMIEPIDEKHREELQDVRRFLEENKEQSGRTDRMHDRIKSFVGQKSANKEFSRTFDRSQSEFILAASAELDRQSAVIAGITKLAKKRR